MSSKGKVLHIVTFFIPCGMKTQLILFIKLFNYINIYFMSLKILIKIQINSYENIYLTHSRMNQIFINNISFLNKKILKSSKSLLKLFSFFLKINII